MTLVLAGVIFFVYLCTANQNRTGMKTKLIFLIFLVAMTLNACKSNELDIPAPSICTGIYGVVTERYGNWQPIWDPNDATRGERPIVREIYVYEYTMFQEIEGSHFAYIDIDKMPHKLVAKTKSLANGFYEMELAPGIYSIFLLEEGQLYANGGDGYGGISPVTVTADSVLYVPLCLDHAVY